MASTIDNRTSDEQEHIIQMMTKYKIEKVICKKFGCGKELTLEEQRMGDHCRQHADQDEILIVKSIRIKWR